VIKGSLLLLPTLGFYRFWLTTDIRRHLWSNTRVGHEGLEYTGTAKELLIGFLIALAILVPIYTGYFILGLVAETAQAFASIPLVIFFYVFGQYAMYRARRYRLTRTTFRGLRFWMAGSGWVYAGKAALWDLATLLSLGLAYPWRTAALERYKMRHSYYGSLSGRFDGTGGDLFARGWWMWAVVIGLPLVLPSLYLLAQPSLSLDQAGIAFGLGAVLFFLLAPILYPLFLAVQTRWFIEGVRFGEAGLESYLAKGSVFLCYFVWVAATIGWGIAFSIVAFIVTAAFGASLASMPDIMVSGFDPRFIPLIASVALLYLVFLLGIGVLKRYFVDRGLWVAVTNSMAIVNPRALEQAQAAGTAANVTGEGLADALDVGAF
jgi:uncharacterized membrane protein YjgN (DUF898 family)